MNSYSKRSNAYRTGAYRTSAYRTAFSLLMIVSVLLGTVVSPMAALAAPPSLETGTQPQAASVNNAEAVAARPPEAASAPVAERALDKPLESSLDAPVAAPAELPGQPDPVVLGSNTITLTKSVVGSTESNFSVNITGPSYPSGAVMPIVSGTQVITGLASGMYTITEVSPGAGWTTTYTTTTGYSTGSSVVVTLMNAITATTFTATQITGTVYADYNGNGLFDRTSTFTETGVMSVTATLYDMTGTAVSTAQTDVNGRFTMTLSSPNNVGPFRVEFSTLPAGVEPSRIFTGTQNGSSVQFINSAAQATNLYFAVNAPCDYCQSAPLLATTTMVAGNQITNVNATTESNDTVVAFGYNSTTSTALPTGLAQAQQVGTTYGVAYQRGSKTIFVTAYMKRHAGFGPSGPGAIYAISAGPDGIAGTNDDVPSTFMILDSATYFGAGSFGVDPHPTSTEGMANSPYNWFHDANSLDDVAKMSFGDLDISEDDQELYTINLYNRSLYRIPIGKTPTAPSVGAINVISVPVTLPNSGANALTSGSGSNQHQTCTQSDVRPFGLGMYHGLVYVGMVCSAQTVNNATSLRAYVYAFDPTNNSFGTAPVLEFPLNYTRIGNFAQTWKPWSDSFATIAASTASDGVASFTNYPEPMLSDIVFDKGQMILGFRDRASDQLGKYAGDTSTSTSAPTAFYYLAATGDILRACSSNDTTWTVENDGSCGGVTTAGTSSNNAGPGGGEYYLGDYAYYGQATPAHVESSQGSMAQVPGMTEVVMSAIDATALNSGGIEWLNNRTGTLADAYKVYQSANPSGVPSSPTSSATPDTTFGKAGGIGDLEALCDPAPIEIGNRVWNDVNGNGVQDPGESGINGVQVSVQSPTSTFTVNTGTDGNWYFAAQPNTDYTITINPNQPALNGYSLTQANQQAISGSTTSNDAILDTRDSDGVLVSSIPTIYYTTGSAGQNNHGLDFGFSKPVTGQVDILNTAPLQQTYDLALRKRVVNQTANVDGSRVVTYTIEVFNQGDASASNIELVDYLPVNGALGTPTNGWTVAGTTLTHTVPGPIAPGASETVTLVLNLNAASSGRWVTNTSEIAADDGDDIDSTPDIINDDKRVDDVINDNPTTGSDEDDHDIAVAPPICPAATIWNGGVYNDSQGAFVTNVEGLDWSSAGSGVFEGIGPIGTSVPVGTQFTLRYQAVLVGLTSPTGSSIGFSNLNTDFEYAIVTEIPLVVISELNIVGTQFLALGTLPGGQVYIYKDTANNAVVTTGSGFDDGELVASGYVNSGQIATFQFVPAISSATGSFTFNAPLTYINSTFLDPTDKLAEFRLEGTLNYPALDSTTTTFFAGRAGEGNLDDYTVTSNDILLKVDTSSKLYECITDAQFGDRVFLEEDGDGLASTGVITAVAGMVITATNGTEIYTTTTGADGYYSFTVPADTYTVTYGDVPAVYGAVVPSTVVSGTSESGNAGSYQQSGNPDANHGQNTVVSLAVGEANWHVDFAFYPAPPAALATFGNFVWIELDGDGIAGNGVITPVVGLVITATDGTNVYTETTDGTGYFSFTVPAGTYTVTYGTPPAGTIPSSTPNSGVISSGSPGTDQSSSPNGVVITLAAGESIPTVDFAFTPALEPVLHLNKTVTPTIVQIGDLITYTLTLTNDGPGEGNNIVVNDLLPSAVTYVTHTASSGTYVVATGDWTIPVMSVGEETLEIIVQIK